MGRTAFGNCIKLEKMTILDKIVANKKRVISYRKDALPVNILEQSPAFQRETLSFKAALQDPNSLGIISEFKRHSPSKGDININAEVSEVTTGYAKAGASALSILTDQQFFKGNNDDLTEARSLNQIPILRKDFIVDEYQIIEAKAIGADVILLIAECLTAEQVAQLAKTAKGLGLDVLIEIHSAEQLPKLVPEIDVVGVNNRNLKDFTVSIKTSIDLFHEIPDDFVKISESGISDPNVIVDLRRLGFQGFLIGEYFMKSDNPAERCAEFIERVHYLEDLYQNAIA